MNIRLILILFFCTYLSLTRAMEPIPSSVPSLKQLAAERAVTTRAFLDEFIDDNECLTRCNLTDAHTDLAQIVACTDRLSIMLAQRIQPIQTIKSMSGDHLLPPHIDFYDLLNKKTEFTSANGNMRANIQNNEEYRVLHIFKRKSNKLWEPQRICNGHLKSITEAAWSADARFLASFSYHEQKIKIWDVASGYCLHTLQYPDGILSAYDQPYWRDNATLFLPSTCRNSETMWHFPWARTSLNDMLVLKALVLRTLPAEKRVELLNRIENDCIKEKMTFYTKRFDPEVRSLLNQ